MPRIIITKQCNDAIKEAATFPFSGREATPVLGGWSIPLEQETIDRLQTHRLENETWSDCILRLLASKQ